MTFIEEALPGLCVTWIALIARSILPKKSKFVECDTFIHKRNAAHLRHGEISVWKCLDVGFATNVEIVSILSSAMICFCVFPFFLYIPVTCNINIFLFLMEILLGFICRSSWFCSLRPEWRNASNSCPAFWGHLTWISGIVERKEKGLRRILGQRLTLMKHFCVSQVKVGYLCDDGGTLVSLVLVPIRTLHRGIVALVRVEHLARFILLLLFAVWNVLADVVVC